MLCFRKENMKANEKEELLKQEIGKRLKKALAATDITYQGIADLHRERFGQNTTKQTIQNFASGFRRPTHTHLLIFAELGVDLHWLISGKPLNPPIDDMKEKVDELGIGNLVNGLIEFAESTKKETKPDDGESIEGLKVKVAEHEKTLEKFRAFTQLFGPQS